MMLTDVSNDLRRPVEAEESTPSWRCRTGVDVEDGPMNMYVLNFHANLSASYSSLCHSVAPDPPFGPQRVCGLHNGPAAILWRTPAPNKSCCSLALKLICRPTRHVRRAAHEHPLILLYMFTLCDLSAAPPPASTWPFPWHHVLAFPRHKHVPLLIYITTCNPIRLHHTASHCSGPHRTGWFRGGKCQGWKRASLQAACALLQGRVRSKTIMAARLITTFLSEPSCQEWTAEGSGPADIMRWPLKNWIHLSDVETSFFSLVHFKPCWSPDNSRGEIPVSSDSWCVCPWNKEGVYMWVCVT